MKLERYMKECPHCASEIPSHAKTCSSCGKTAHMPAYLREQFDQKKREREDKLFKELALWGIWKDK